MFPSAQFRATAGVALSFGLALAIAVPAHAEKGNTITVGSCPGAQFPTIQQGVDAASPGGTVLVCPGVYPEQVTITKSLTVEGIQVNTMDAAIIVPPSGGVVPNAASLSSGNPIDAQVLAHDASKINLNNLAVDGTGNLIAGCAPNLIGILYQNASGKINNVAARHQKLVPASLNGCQSGLGIFVQSGTEPGVTPGSQVLVNNSSVHDYQKNGITGNEIGTQLTVENSSVVGQGATTGAAENGIQIGFGATGSINDNFVSDDVWEPDMASDPGDAAAGILVFSATSVDVGQNVVSNTQFGIALVGDPLDGAATNNRVMNNTVSATHIFDAIDGCGNNNKISSNTIMSAQESGIHLDGTCGGSGNNNQVNNNSINEACVGVLAGSTTSGNNVNNSNQYFNVVNTTAAGDTATCTPPQSPDTTSTGGGFAMAHLASSVSSSRAKVVPLR
jgi:hypothetical protein